MTYPDTGIYECKFCKRRFDFSYGFNSPRLVEHLLMEHNEPVMSRYGNLYLSDMVKECFERKGGSYDRRNVCVPSRC